eukprot:6497653-Alexandrium_andersonii.AAC.1
MFRHSRRSPPPQTPPPTPASPKRDEEGPHGRLGDKSTERATTDGREGSNWPHTSYWPLALQ